MRAAICLTFLLLCCFPRVSSAAPRPSLGVIRWDGYNGSPVWTQSQEFGFLRPAEHHWRLPWFVSLTGEADEPFSFNRDFAQAEVQRVTDAEIEYAASAGIDYWAFCHFGRHKGDGWQLRNNLQAYLDSPRKGQINFALICIGTHVGAGIGDIARQKTWSDWKAYVEEYVELAREATYQHVLDKRPLFYLFDPEGLSANLGDTDDAVTQLREAVEYLRERFEETGHGNPYVVGMNAGGIWAAKYVDEAGLDAISAYRGAFGATSKGTPFEALWGNINKEFLENPAMGGGDRKVVVPILSGADQTPRDPESPRYLEPEPGDLKKLVHSAFDYVARYPEKCESRTVLMYAWNEHSEGGFVCPIIGKALDPDNPDTSRLDEIGCAIRTWQAPESRPR